MEDYTIEQLEKTFKEHSESFTREEKLRKEKYGDDYITPTFDISAALHVICKEINQINRMKSEEIRCKSMNRFSQLPSSVD